VNRRLLGSLVGVAAAFALGAALLPLRSHLSVSAAALVLVIPVVVGAVMGGFVAGASSVAAGFLVYDYEFIPPYKTLHVGSAQNWTALVVYVVVMLLVARIVDALEKTRSEASRSHDVMRRVAEVSELLVGDQPVKELLKTIVTSAQTVFNVPGVALLELEGGRLVVVASAGEPLTSEELHRLDPHSGVPVRVGTAPGTPNELRTVALSSSGRAMGILAMRGVPIEVDDRAVLNTFANDAALALERAELREQALRSKLLEEADRFRRGLLGAVSHDLRTPLATIKVASSTLNDRAAFLSAEDSRELHQLIEIESDRLTRLVTNLLDMTRIEAGVLSLDRSVLPVAQLVKDAVTVMGSTLNEQRVDVQIPDSLPDVYLDHVLMGQALVNLLDNAARHSPPHGVITVRGEQRGERIVISVSDQGPGVPPDDRETIFDRFTQLSTGGRAGLGLTIAKTFVEAHGEHVWYEEVPEGGARFVFSLPRADAKST
jgi:two-component system, OmpR family, sensor histidine kinase KdpD